MPREVFRMQASKAISVHKIIEKILFFCEKTPERLHMCNFCCNFAAEIALLCKNHY